VKQTINNCLNENDYPYNKPCELTHDGFLIIENGYFVDCNSKALELFCCKRNEIIGKTQGDISPAYQDNGELSVEKYEKLIKFVLAGNPQFFEWKFIKKNKSIFYAMVSLSKVVISKKNFIHCVLRDITDKIRSTNEIIEMNKELVQNNKELEHLIYLTSHDLRTPLLNIQGFSEELKRLFKNTQKLVSKEKDLFTLKQNLSGLLYKDIPESLDFISISGNKLNKLITGILNLSKLGKMEINPALLNMNKLINEIVISNNYLIKAYKINVICGELPEVFADEIIGNAIKFRKNKGKAFIKIQGSKTTSDIIYSVADNGIGISPEFRDKIFMLFHKFDQKTEGEGVGLAIVKKLLAKHNGNIWVESEPGKGSKFFISFPLK